MKNLCAFILFTKKSCFNLQTFFPMVNYLLRLITYYGELLTTATYFLRLITYFLKLLITSTKPRPL
jgi:hypothetical protein